RLLQAALTASHAPSEALDSQFPASAAARLYAALIAPVEDCVRPGDHLIWLPAAAITPVPLAALLPEPPPAQGKGFDLSEADWLIKRNAISYAGSASLIAAARGPGARIEADRDFLGVGDPLLAGVTSTGASRAELVTRGTRRSGHAPLPEPRAELRESAVGF